MASCSASPYFKLLSADNLPGLSILLGLSSRLSLLLKPSRVLIDAGRYSLNIFNILIIILRGNFFYNFIYFIIKVILKFFIFTIYYHLL